MFKSISLYQFNQELGLSVIEIEAILELNPFKELSAIEEKTYGFIPISNDMVTFKKGKGILFAIQTEFKPINKKAVNQEATKKVKTIQETENRKVKKAERDTIVNEVYHNVLLTTLPVDELIHVYITDEFVAVNTSSSKKAEEVLSYLRSIFRTLDVVPLENVLTYNNEFTNWVLSPISKPSDITLMSPFKLVRINDDESTESITLKVNNTNDPAIPPIAEFLSTFNITTLSATIGDYQFTISDKFIITNCKSNIDFGVDDSSYYLITDMVEFMWNKLTKVFNDV